MKKFQPGVVYIVPFVEEISLIAETNDEENEIVEYTTELTKDTVLNINVDTCIQAIFHKYQTIEKQKYACFACVVSGERVLIPADYLDFVHVCKHTGITFYGTLVNFWIKPKTELKHFPIASFWV